MWYFSWMLGTALACSFTILTAVWFELHDSSSSGTSAQS